MLKIGLTGGIGCGKTTVSDLFANLGVPVIDADIIARRLLLPGQETLIHIKARFPEVFNSDLLDKDKLRALVFSQPEEKAALEQIIHPRVFIAIDKEISELEAPYCILSVPLLLESNMAHKVDRVLVIDCPVEQQKKRVMKRDGHSESLISSIIATQINREQRLLKADDIIDNSNSRSELAEQVKNLHNLYVNQSKLKAKSA